MFTSVVISGIDTESPPGAITEPSPSPAYDIQVEIDAVTPTCISLTWELSPPVNSDAYANNAFRIVSVKQWKIELVVEPMEQKNDMFLAGSIRNITIGPFPLGSIIIAKVCVHRYIKPDGMTKDVNHISGSNTYRLPSMYNFLP